MAYIGWTGPLETPAIQNAASKPSAISAVVTRALNDTMITPSATTNPWCYPNLTNGADTPTVMTTLSVATNLISAAAEFAVTGTMRDLYSELVSSNGPIVKCLKQIPYAAGRTIYWVVRPIPFTNRWILQMDY